MTISSFVSAASGAVGSVACQIAKIKGFRVVGSVGSQEKVKWLLDQAGIDYAFNYKEVGENNISSELRKACPNGINIYFDNVGGKHLEAAIDNMKVFGRIVLCGMISHYINNMLNLLSKDNIIEKLRVYKRDQNVTNFDSLIQALSNDV